MTTGDASGLGSRASTEPQDASPPSASIPIASCSTCKGLRVIVDAYRPVITAAMLVDQYDDLTKPLQPRLAGLFVARSQLRKALSDLAQTIEALCDETPQAAQPVGRERDPAGDAPGGDQR